MMNEIPERESRILAARKRDDAVVLVLAAVLLDQCVQLELARRPVDVLLAELMSAADIAHAYLIELDRLIGLWQQTFLAVDQLTHFETFENWRRLGPSAPRNRFLGHC